MYETRELFGETVRIQIPSEVFPTAEQIAEMDAITGANCQHGWYDSASDEGDEKGKKAKIHYRYWLPEGQKPKGILVFTMGILSETSHAARIDGRPVDVALMVDTFLAKGIAVYAKDQYGHGLSEGLRMYVPTWQQARDDAINMIKLAASKHPTDIPLFLAGESMGGCLTVLAAKYIQDNPSEAPPNFDSFLLICPAIEVDLPPLPVYLILRYILAPLMPTAAPSFMPDSVGADRLWRDPKIREYYQDPAKEAMGLGACGAKLRLGTAVSILGAANEARKKAIPGLASPFCIIHGSADDAVPSSGSELLMNESATPEGDKEFHILDGAYHAILADPKAEEGMKHLASFVDGRLQKFVPPQV